MMTPFLNSHAVLISTLSPVHVGCGEDYEPTNYVIHDKKLSAFDPAKLLAALTQRDRDELTRALDDKNPVLAAQRFFYRHRELAAKLSTHQIPVIDAINAFYESRFGKVVQREDGNKSVINHLELARTAYNPYSQFPLLPGSSLKGAMRTALLEALRHEKRKQYPLQRPGDMKEGSRTAKAMEVDLLGGSFETDPLRLLKVSDAAFLPDNTYTAKNPAGESIQRKTEPRRICFQVNRKKHPNQFASQASINTLIECVPAGQPKSFAASLDFEHKAGLDRRLTPALQLDFQTLAKTCNQFYLERFEAEAEILQANRYVSETWMKNARTRLQPAGIWGKLIEQDRGFLLRVGRHSGAESVTIDAPRSIKIMKGKKNFEYRQEATTLWLASDDKDAQQNMQPFGWVFVQLR